MLAWKSGARDPRSRFCFVVGGGGQPCENLVLKFE
ncbi:hypothetical protein NC652_000693 [Populus alba x Populus x berolinensis]|uniref:Uncharacterized protein n=1 Tax=Populus alba x Populus x berolinensis TaxID=444605 RepID=A0AAD6WF53_9ROSI|nr:hypothetical protein NC652_000693 [Populus alba x Populus x berolinensis]KAJ7010072.1 hypothetical protein NC653_000716 [Populus alba x Populus x berolinensis]